MKKNLFEMGADFGDGWSADNRKKQDHTISNTIMEPDKHKLHFSKERRRGKVVTIVKPFFLTKNDLQALLKLLKKRLGTGGTLRENTLEFQGDIPDRLKKHLERLGYGLK